MSDDFSACGKKAQLRVMGDMALLAHSSVDRYVDFYCIEPVGHDTPHRAIVLWDDEGRVSRG